MSKGPNSINCTSCGAGLDVLGGGRVLAQACGYCGALLDAQDNYKVLAKYENLTRPATRLRLGDQGVIDGVSVTVIGIKGMQERYRGKVWEWVDHQVFSPTHGYGWITEEDGHLTFTRKSRDTPRPAWISPARVETSESPPTAQFRGGRYVYYETSQARISFLEGEFNWVPKMGDRSDAVSLLGPEGVLSFRGSPAEREVEITRILPPETWASFGVSDPPVARGVHPAQPHAGSPHAPFLRKLFIGCIAATLVLAIGLPQFSAPRQPLGDLAMRDFPQTFAFEVNDLSRPVKIGLDTNLSNQWAYFEIGVTDPQGATLFEAGRTISFYSGGAGEDAWSEGSRHASLVFEPTIPGSYALEISLEEADRGRIARLFDRGRMSLWVQEGHLAYGWLFGAALGFMLALIAASAGKFLHRKRRFAGSDWSDD